MPTLRPLPPSTTRKLLESHGHVLVGEDQYNWAFMLLSRPEVPPVIIPHAVDLIPIEITRHVAYRVGLTTYFDAISSAGDPFPAPTDEPSATD